MSKRPIGDLGALTVSKATAADAVPFVSAAAAAPVTPTPGMPKSLTVKLDAATYAKLRAYCFAQEQTTGSRITHQEVMVRALVEMLARQQA